VGSVCDRSGTLFAPAQRNSSRAKWKPVDALLLDKLPAAERFDKCAVYLGHYSGHYGHPGYPFNRTTRQSGGERPGRTRTARAGHSRIQFSQASPWTRVRGIHVTGPKTNHSRQRLRSMQPGRGRRAVGPIHEVFQSAAGIIRRIYASNSGTVKAVSP
jgi:hypothetical protein